MKRIEADAEDEESDAFRDTLICGMGWLENRLDHERDPDGKPLGVMPRLLVVPVDLEVTAMRLMNSQQLFLAGTAGSVTERGDTNPFYGRYQVVSSVYASNTAYTLSAGMIVSFS